MWPPNSPDLNPVDYAVWGALQQMVYRRRRFTSIEQLRRASLSRTNCYNVSLIAPLVSGVAGSSASSSSMEDTLNVKTVEDYRWWSRGQRGQSPPPLADKGRKTVSNAPPFRRLNGMMLANTEKT